MGRSGFFESLLNGPKAVSSEVLGPYPLKADERFLLGQQFNYPSHLVGEYDVELTYRKGDIVLGKQSHKIDLKKECVQDSDCPADNRCAEKLCVAVEKSSVTQLVGRGLAIATFISAVRLVGYSLVIYRKRKKRRMHRRLEDAFDAVVADFVVKEFGRRVPQDTNRVRESNDYRELISGAVASFRKKKVQPSAVKQEVRHVEKDIQIYGKTLLEFLKHTHADTSAIVKALVQKGWNEKIVQRYIEFTEGGGNAEEKHRQEVRDKIKGYNAIIWTFINKGLDRGFSKEQIEAALVKKGLDRKLVELYMDFVLRNRKR